jgi:hypothetical protein
LLTGIAVEYLIYINKPISSKTKKEKTIRHEERGKKEESNRYREPTAAFARICSVVIPVRCTGDAEAIWENDMTVIKAADAAQA